MSDSPLLTCVQCHKLFPKNVRRADFCGPVCRLQASRARKRLPEHALRTIQCPTCKTAFQQKRHDQRYCSIDCRQLCHTTKRHKGDPSNIQRVFYDPQPGDLIQSGDLFRWVVARGMVCRKHPVYGTASRLSDCVTFRNLPSNEEHMMKLSEWKNWCKMRSNAERTAVKHVLTRKARPVFVETDEAVAERQAQKAFIRQFNLERGNP